MILMFKLIHSKRFPLTQQQNKQHPRFCPGNVFCIKKSHEKLVELLSVCFQEIGFIRDILQLMEQDVRRRKLAQFQNET